MPNTPTLGLPYPANTEPLANAAAAIQALASAIEGVHPAKFTRGRVTTATDASGDITITHGLGTTPVAVLVSSGVSSGGHIVAAHTFTATTFKARDRVSSTGAIFAGSPTIDWIAFA